MDTPRSHGGDAPTCNGRARAARPLAWVPRGSGGRGTTRTESTSARCAVADGRCPSSSDSTCTSTHVLSYRAFDRLLRLGGGIGTNVEDERHRRRTRRYVHLEDARMEDAPGSGGRVRRCARQGVTSVCVAFPADHRDDGSFLPGTNDRREAPGEFTSRTDALESARAIGEHGTVWPLACIRVRRVPRAPRHLGNRNVQHDDDGERDPATSPARG